MTGDAATPTIEACVRLLESVCQGTPFCEWCAMDTAMQEMLQCRSLVAMEDTSNKVHELAAALGVEDEAMGCANAASHRTWYLCRDANGGGGEPSVIFLVTNRRKIGMAHLKAIYHRVRVGDTYALPMYLVAKHRISSFAQQSMKSLHIARVEVFSILWAEVLHNPLRHYMVPPHRPVTRAYVRKQMSSVPRLAISELPKIRLCDPVVRYLGLRTGQVVAIQRGPHEEAYRVVVP